MAITRRIRPGGSADGWRWGIAKPEFLGALGTGLNDAAIARHFGVHRSLIGRMKRSLTLEEWIRAHERSVRLLARRGGPVSATSATAVLAPIDAAGLVLNTLEGVGLLMAAIEKRLKLRTPRPVLAKKGMEMATYLRAAQQVYRGVLAAVAVQDKLTEWFGEEELRRSVLWAFNELGPEGEAVKARFLEKLQERMAMLRATRDAAGTGQHPDTDAAGDMGEGLR